MTTYSGLLTDYIGAGVIADRPATPTGYNPDVAVFWYATDTDVLSAWNGMTWEDVGAGGGLPTGGSTGQVLTKQSGTDFDVDWETPSGGGGGSSPFMSIPRFRPNAGTAFGTGNFGGRAIMVDRDCDITHVCGYVATANILTQVRPGIYSAGAGGNINALLASGPQVTGVTLGLNEFALTTPLTVTAGTALFVGVQIATSAPNMATVDAGSDTFFFASSGALSNPAPGASYGSGASMCFFPKVA